MKTVDFNKFDFIAFKIYKRMHVVTYVGYDAEHNKKVCEPYLKTITVNCLVFLAVLLKIMSCM